MEQTCVLFRSARIPACDKSAQAAQDLADAVQALWSAQGLARLREQRKW